MEHRGLPDEQGEALADVELDVTADRLTVSARSHALDLFLPARVKHKRGAAAWDAARGTLTVTVPLDKGGVFGGPGV